ncbi:MAG: hypothetical protein ACLT98_13830 [Eggerthellaceae bacterium]
MLLAVIVFFVVFSYGVRLWRIGQPNRSDHVRDVCGERCDAVLQLRVLREKKGGLIHLAMYAACWCCFWQQR